MAKGLFNLQMLKKKGIRKKSLNLLQSWYKTKSLNYAHIQLRYLFGDLN